MRYAKISLFAAASILGFLPVLQVAAVVSGVWIGERIN
jgi:hypothetical protein